MEVDNCNSYITLLYREEFHIKNLRITPRAQSEYLTIHQS